MHRLILTFTAASPTAELEERKQTEQGQQSGDPEQDPHPLLKRPVSADRMATCHVAVVKIDLRCEFGQ
jgi:hypothetical protein